VAPRTSSSSAGGDPTAPLRERIINRHAFGGFGPFIVAIILLVLMVIFVPTVAPERETIIEPTPTPLIEPAP
jgi:hypothetical protein